MPKRKSPKSLDTLPSLTRELERKSDGLLKTVRQLARAQQTDAPQIFLSLRQAARRFDVPLSMMAAVFRQLGEEGILSTVRSSRTILRGRNSTRHLQVRGVVGIPVSGPRLHTLRDYRESFLSLRNELHADGFSIVPLYSEVRAIDPDILVQRSKKERVDMVVCLLPDGAARETAERLRDLGIRFIGLNIGGVSDTFCRYEVRRRQAILTILNRWRAEDDYKAATIVLAGHETGAEMDRITRLRAFIAREGIACVVETVPEGRVSRFLKSLCAKKKEVLLPAPVAAMLASRAPDTVADVFLSCRVALIDGPLDTPVGKADQNIRVDLVAVNWDRIAKRIAHDIMSGEAFAQSETTIFEGKALLDAPLTKSALKD